MVVEIRYGYRDLSDEKSNVHAGSLNLCANVNEASSLTRQLRGHWRIRSP
jgi:hypothetical protein